MSFFTELRRRNIFKVAIAYSVAAWLILQLVDLVLDNINAPDWVMQVFMLAVAVGLPIAIIIAWAFEVTPEGVKLARNVDQKESITKHTGQQLNRGIIVILSVAIVFLLTERFRDEIFSASQPTAADTQTTADAEAEHSAADSVKSIAVLPFVDMSPDGDQAYFADGISEEILNVLVKTQSLKVAGRTSSFQFRDHSTDLQSIGEQLGVNHILEGSIRKANNRVRITAQLVTASDGFHLWSETYDRDLTDIFAVQDEIASAITKALAIELDISEGQQSPATPRTGNMQAYDRYLEAIGLIARRVDFHRAISLLNEATELDPAFAAGWAANAQAHSLIFYYHNDLDRHEVLGKAESMARRALQIDPNHSMAYSVLGDVHRDRYEWMEAKDNYLRALSLNPNNIEANEQFAQMLWRAGYFDEALEYSTKATDLDPLSWLNLTVHAALRYVSGDHDGGWQDMQRALKIGGGNRYFPLRHAINIAICEGRIDTTIELMKNLSNANQDYTFASGKRAKLDEFIEMLHSREDTLNFLAANVDQTDAGGINSIWATDLYWAAYYGDYDLAEVIFEKGTANNDGSLLFDMTWFNYPITNPLRNTEPYRRLVKSMKLDAFWHENGFPKNCRAVGDDDYACN